MTTLIVLPHVELCPEGAVLEAEPGPLPAGAAEPGLTAVTLVLDLGHNSTELLVVGAKGPIAVRSVRRAGRRLPC